MPKSIPLSIGAIIITQSLQVLLIALNQGTNPLLFIAPLDIAMLGALLYVGGRYA